MIFLRIIYIGPEGCSNYGGEAQEARLFPTFLVRLTISTEFRTYVRSEHGVFSLCVTSISLSIDFAAMELYRERIKQLEKNEDEQRAIVTELKCENANLQRKLLSSHAVIENLEKLNMEFAKYYENARTIISRRNFKIQELTLTLDAKTDKVNELQDQLFQKNVILFGRRYPIPKLVQNVTSKESDRRVNSNQSEVQLSEQSNELKKIKNQMEQYRQAAIALKNLIQFLPSARMTDVDWVKSGSARTERVHQHRKDILNLPQYALLSGEYVIENNPGYVRKCRNDKSELDAVKQFADLNGTDNPEPTIITKQANDSSHHNLNNVNDVIRTRTITKCRHCPQLVGQQECFAKMDIDKGVILGQYTGNEMLAEEYRAIFKGTREDIQRSCYLWSVPLKMKSKRIHIVIDAFGACKSPLSMYINDGRKDIKKDCTKADRKRMNTEYISVLCNGWPTVWARTTKKIKAGESLWIDYGPKYGELLDEQTAVQAERQKQQWWVDRILSRIDLEENKPLEILSDDDGGQSTEFDQSTKRNRNAFESDDETDLRPTKKVRFDLNE